MKSKYYVQYVSNLMPISLSTCETEANSPEEAIQNIKNLFCYSELEIHKVEKVDNVIERNLEE